MSSYIDHNQKNKLIAKVVGAGLVSAKTTKEYPNKQYYNKTKKQIEYSKNIIKIELHKLLLCIHRKYDIILYIS